MSTQHHRSLADLGTLDIPVVLAIAEGDPDDSFVNRVKAQRPDAWFAWEAAREAWEEAVGVDGLWTALQSCPWLEAEVQTRPAHLEDQPEILARGWTSDEVIEIWLAGNLGAYLSPEVQAIVVAFDQEGRAWMANGGGWFFVGSIADLGTEVDDHVMWCAKKAVDDGFFEEDKEDSDEG